MDSTEHTTSNEFHWHMQVLSWIWSHNKAVIIDCMYTIWISEGRDIIIGRGTAQ